MGVVLHPTVISDMTNVQMCLLANLPPPFLTADSLTATDAQRLGCDSVPLSDTCIIRWKIQFKIRSGLHV